jgi:hypothetical protein
VHRGGRGAEEVVGRVKNQLSDGLDCQDIIRRPTSSPSSDCRRSQEHSIARTLSTLIAVEKMNGLA